MCQLSYHAEVFRLYVFWGYVVSTMAMNARVYLTSPCPDTFQYQMDSNGGLYGAVGVYSLDDNIVQLDLELSVGNVVDSYNGEIQLLSPKSQVVNDLQHLRPIRYKVIFPRWQNIPPRVTKIMVNGQLVCSGPKIPLSGWVSVLTTINLQHTLRLKVSTLQANIDDFVPKNRDDLYFISQKPNAPVVPQEFDIIKLDPQPSGDSAKAEDKPYQKNPFLSSNKPFFNTLSTTSRPAIINSLVTTETSNFNLIPTSDFVTGRNPFIGGGKPSVSREEPSPSPTLSSRDPTVESSQPFSNICGQPVVSNPLVISGHSVPRGAFPWLAAMFSVKDTGLEYKCSGSLITKRHVVTAAHCVKDERRRIRPEEILFVLGKLNIRKWTPLEGEKMIDAESIHAHPDYKPYVSDADIAVVVLNGELAFTNFIRPICLWSESTDLKTVVGQTGKVVGWGKDEKGQIMTEEPKQVTIPVVSQDECLRSADAFQYLTTNRTFCAGTRDGSGPCNGDSGSGFVMKRNGKWVLRGVVSISTFDSAKQSCDLSNYVVFTDASKHREWLLSVIK